MIKYFENDAINNSGEYSTQVVSGSKEFTKIAGYSNLGDDVQKFIQELSEKKDVAYLLISALSDMNWGPNRNGDGWPEVGLSNPGPEYGYETFKLFGHYYHLHDNKDPKKSFGKVVFSAWNSQMHRVELIVEVDLKKDAKTRNAIDNGDIIQTSMGAKVSYDICNVCHPNWIEFYKIPEEDMKKLSKTRSLDVIYAIGEKHGVDLSYITELHPKGGAVGIHATQDRYCEHMKRNRNRILENGQKVCVINLRPKFFDISFVRVNADKSSFVLAKVAEDIEMQRMGEDEVTAMMDKKESTDKTSDITKKIDGDIISSDVDEIKDYYEKIILPKLYDKEPELDNKSLNEIGTHPLEKILSSFMAMGMFPKPKEFQRIMLVSQGKKDLADKFDDEGMHITDADVNKGGCGLHLSQIAKDLDLSGENADEELLELLSSHAKDKSYYRPSVVKRIIIIKEAEGEINSYLPAMEESRSPLPGILAAIAAFLGVAKLTGSKSMLKIVKDLSNHKLALIGSAMGAQAASELIRQNRSYQASMNGKMASIGSTLGTFVGLPAASYIYSEHAMNKARQGQPLSTVDKATIKHPMAVGVTAALLANKSSRTKLMSALGKLLKVGEEMKSAGIEFEGLNIEDYNVKDQDGIIIGIWNALDKSVDRI